MRLRKKIPDSVPEPKPERQELWCHDCEHYVQFTVDLSLNGNHVLNCPNCGHEHCRVVENGRITDIRWDSRNGRNQRVYYVSASTATFSSTSTYTTYSSSSATTNGDPFLYMAWMNTGAT